MQRIEDVGTALPRTAVMNEASPATVAGKNLPSCSIVIPSRNRQHDVVRCLNSIASFPTQPHQIIVVDQSECAYTLPQMGGLVHLHRPNLSGLTAARNAGIREATSDIIFFLDDDCELVADCVRIVGQAFLDHRDAIGISCNVIEPPGWRKLSLSLIGEHIFHLGFFSAGPIRTKEGRFLRNSTGVAAFRRSLFEHELYDEQLTGYCLGEDWEFSLRARRYGNIRLAGEARVTHHRSIANRYELRRYLISRWKNRLYFYDKLADKTIWDRFCRLWWIAGESLRWIKAGMGLPFLNRGEHREQL